MTLRWVRTIDESPHMFPAPIAGPEADEDWLLYSGGCLVGRLSRDGGVLNQLAWRLTRGDAINAPVPKVGSVASIEEGKEQLIAAYRSWAAWAGITRDGTAPMRWMPADRGDMAELAMSGGLKFGFVAMARYAPPSGPHWIDQPHWMLTVLTAPDRATFQRAGFADSIDAAKAALTAAWCAYLAWAELPAIEAAP